MTNCNRPIVADELCAEHILKRKGASRQYVYQSIDSERDYQDTKHHHDHSILEFAVFMRTYLEELFSEATHASVRDRALETMRKVVALGVACMEQHGAPHRKRAIINDTLDPGPR